MSLTSYRAAPPRDNLFRAASLLRIALQAFALTSSTLRSLDIGGDMKELFSWFVYSLFCLLLVFSRPGSDLLSHTLRCSTISAKAFHGRVRKGIGCSHLAMTTRPAKDNLICSHASDASHHRCEGAPNDWRGPLGPSSSSFSLTQIR